MAEKRGEKSVSTTSQNTPVYVPVKLNKIERAIYEKIVSNSSITMGVRFVSSWLA